MTAARKLTLKSNEVGRYRLELSFDGDVAIDIIESELCSVSALHELPEAGGGAYLVAARQIDGPTINFPGGIYIPHHKAKEVYASLRELGYELIL